VRIRKDCSWGGPFSGKGPPQTPLQNLFETDGAFWREDFFAFDIPNITKHKF
jgi:hypothetical protein